MLALTRPNLTLDGFLNRHVLKLRGTHQAAVFDEFGVRMCLMDTVVCTLFSVYAHAMRCAFCTFVGMHIHFCHTFFKGKL